ncbi:MAG: DNA-protecting protein DprA, partial [Candidatus Omnitrophota bacterium]
SYRLACLGACVVSGLARGIDTAAHKGALKGHGRTIAVLGSGLGSVYPPENKRLVSDIVDKGGAVVSEFSVLERPNPRNFPRRNRIISGLSLGTVVVEAARNSGALITADFALNQGREVFAVPGKADSPTSFGTNRLIKQGARLIQNAEDILQELGLSLRQAPPEENIHQTLSDKEKTIYDKLTDEPRFLDEIARDSGVPVFAAMDSLTRLQLKKLVREFPGKRFTKETKCLRP